MREINVPALGLVVLVGVSGSGKSTFAARHFLPTQVIYHLFGTSIFTLRMAAVLWGIPAVPLMYTLGRRLGGLARAGKSSGRR